MMKNKKQVEYIILIVLWINILLSFIIRLPHFFHDWTFYTGLVALSIVTAVYYFKPQKILFALTLFCLVGITNVLSFSSFSDFVFNFSLQGITLPSLRLDFMVILVILILKRKTTFLQYYRRNFTPTQENKTKNKLAVENRFKTKFSKLSDEEIEIKLKQKLVPEAIEALQQLRAERKMKS